MDAVTAAYLGSSAVLVVAGLVMVAMAVRAYRATERRSMMYLSVGFTVVVAATVGTAIAVFASGATGTARTVLMVNNGLTSVGYVFVVYSLVSYEA
ncbi:MAG: hypothetical protein ABEJ43_09390 [Haloferacaceae archaeon]